MDVSLVVPTRDAGPILEEVLDAVAAQPGAERLEKVAVDSGSRDDTVARLARHGFRVIQIDPAEFDHGSTRDLAISQTAGEVVVLLTQDAVPADGCWLPALLACYRDPRVAAASSRQIPRPGCNPIIARRIEGWITGGAQRIIQEPLSPAEFESLQAGERHRRCVYDNVAGSVRRSAWEKHRFGPHAFGEDLRFAKRALLDGWRIVFEPESVVVHSHERSAWAEARRIFCDHLNLAELFGFRAVSSFRDLREQMSGSRSAYAHILTNSDLSPTRRRELRGWARRYLAASYAAMFLAGRAAELEEGPLGFAFCALDRRLRRGI